MKHTNLILFFSIFILASFVPARAEEDAQALIQECYKKGNAYYLGGKYKEAQEQYQKALSLAAQGAETGQAKAAPRPRARIT